MLIFERLKSNMASIKENYYYKNRVAIIAIGKKQNVDWSVSVNMFDNEHGVPADCDAQRKQFYDFVRGKRFDADGNITGYSKIVNGKDTFIDQAPSEAELAAMLG